jgi:RNA-directed DNA polymerase
MLTALENGVKGGRWYCLYDKVIAECTLTAAFAKVKANRGAPGVDHVTVEMFAECLETNLEKLQESLRAGTYRPQAIRRKLIPKPGKKNEYRPLGIPTVRDRTVQAALRQVLEPIFERDFAEHSYGFRPGRRCKDALRRVEMLLKTGYPWVVDADLKSYFDTIPKEKLLARVREKVSDGSVLQLLEQFLNQPVMEGLNSWTPETGTPQGAVISPLLSNIYLDPLDWEMAAAGVEMVRYADDFVLLCRTEEEAAAALERVAVWTAQAGLTLHPDKTRIVDATNGSFEFLGYRFDRGRKWPGRKATRRLKDKVRVRTKRTNGTSMETIITGLNQVLVGWMAYFKHAHKATFPGLDGWIRMRLRSILRKRHRLKGRGRGADHQRWPNAFFAKLGLYSLTAAHALACQSSRR